VSCDGTGSLALNPLEVKYIKLLYQCILMYTIFWDKRRSLFN